ncbi:hypothetical protein APR64_00430 [Enterobacter hormaechei]|nr:hypothetical protein AXJ76_11255 [Enterobacter cloacae]KJL69706.1 hypothetical protein SS38_17710 [Enterobacter hormaechei subsp. xiangfangensis]KUH54144.1 hypothetical protein APR64_00430 [Enterobacter hormaechei]KJM71367.1 hypothetical protein SS16_21495 [Enterobacter hormaechei subsp. xiangfangensis]KJN72297.1 hypothetical protein SS48_21770 [Enterobacter hormaechei subsp. xiangfangensis]
MIRDIQRATVIHNYPISGGFIGSMPVCFTIRFHGMFIHNMITTLINGVKDMRRSISTESGE